MFCTAYGVKTHYQKIGKGSPFVLLHGWGCTWEIWSPVIQSLSDTYELIIPDLPGFGASSHSEQAWDSYAYAEWLQDFIAQTVGHKKFQLLGHSFGGKVASIYAATYPKNIEHLYIVDASGLPDPLPKEKLLQQSLVSIIPQFVKDAIPFSVKKKLFVKFQASDDYLVANPYLKKVLKLIFPEYIESELRKITTGTTVLWGQHDAVTPIHQGEKFASIIPNATLVRFAQSGHYPFIDESKKFIETVS